MCEVEFQVFFCLMFLFFGWMAYSFFYFKSQGFKEVKQKIDFHTQKCNDLNRHIENLKNSYSSIKSYDYGDGQLSDASLYSFKRREWSKNIKHYQVHNCSLAVCRGASNQPFKYLCKYFDIRVNEDSLVEMESLLNNFAAAEQGKRLLLKERELIVSGVKELIPPLIWHFKKEILIKKLGFESIDLSDVYFPKYTFQYVSAGGNSSVKFDVVLNVDNLDRFIKYLSDIVKFRKSVAGQRALMTSSLREKIKSRDNFTCKICGLSNRDEENLLLEIDHIIPLSKGGITSENNLQTLCWKCNRSKGSKV